LTRIAGLRELLRDPDGPGGELGYAGRFMATNLTQISNLLMGGPGGDMIESRAGDDFLDGDAYLRVRLEAGGTFYDSAAQLEAAVFAGTINPGTINIARDIVVDPPNTDPAAPPEIDTAVYEWERSTYDIVDLGDGYYEVINLVGNDGDPVEGNDVIRNFEVIQFGDQCVLVDPTLPPAEWGVCETAGTVTLTWPGSDELPDPLPPVEDDPAGIVATVTLAPSVATPVTEVRFNWQAGETGEAWDPSESGDNGLPDVPNGLVDTFIPGSADAMAIMRVVVTFRDANGQFHSIASAATPEVEGVNDAPTMPVLTPTDPTVGGAVRVGPFDDEDGVEGASEPGGITYQWLSSPTLDPDPANWSPVGGPTTDPGVLITPDLEGQHITVLITYTDDQDTGEEIFVQPPTNQVAALP
jgi:hypothetical protein